jgi:myo-inositol-1(or 4)-monophosphatase
MKLSAISGKILQAMEMLEHNPQGEFKYAKNGNVRDVVTQSDLELHRIMREFCNEEFPRSLFISEEGELQDGVCNVIAGAQSVMLVDPLDGSNNLVCGFREYGFMACTLENGKFQDSLVVLPSHNQILNWSASQGISTSRQLEVHQFASASTYLAYAPKLEPNFLQIRTEIWDVLDQFSSGLYRYGSACVGLYRTLIGSHSTFIGLQMRPWDVVAFLPILASHHFRIGYSCSKDEILVVVSKNDALFDAVERLLVARFGELLEFRIDEGLRVTR